jgi:hypothetical protein
MKPNEEIIACQYELGSAIAQWGHVELQSLRAVMECAPPADRSALAIGYHSIENFRSKLQYCDNLIQHKFKKSAHLAEWKACKERVSAASTKRNKIAHGWHHLYFHNTPGRRWAIIPVRLVEGELLHMDGDKPPPGALCLRDLAAIHREFHALTTQLANVVELLRRGRYVFSSEQMSPKATPTLAQILKALMFELGVTQRAGTPKGKNEHLY